MLCPACRYPNPENASQCAQCGAPQSTFVLEKKDDHLGQIIGGRFRVIRLLGEGGMGRVYLAEQPMGRALRKVAVKTLRSQYASDARIVARFERECSLVSQLEHPNTIQFFDYGQTPSGSLYIVMEYVEGHTLAEVLAKEGPMPPVRVGFILQQICGALEEAHQRGIVHRDLKPSNIMLTTRAGQRDFVKVLDFGIAKGQSAFDASNHPVTQDGLILGTPPYMSPEQFTGQSVDARSDIYSLGVIAYQMLTGSLPFVADKPWQWAMQHLEAAPFPLEVHPSSARMPLSMKAAVMRALSKNPAERPSSARTLLEELTAHAATQSFTKTSPQGWPSNGHTEFAEPRFASAASIPTIPEGPRGSLPIKRSAGRALAIGLALLGMAGIAIVGIARTSESPSAKTPPEAPSPHPTSPNQPAVLPKILCPEEMSWIPGGMFTMGDPHGDADERPAHQVSIAGFCMDRTEVTARAFAACAQSGACAPAASTVDWAGISDGENEFWSQFCTGHRGDLRDHPVTCVDWQQANAYCRSRGKRLPTEEEWEYAARNGSEGRTYPWGDDAPGPHRLNACGSECAEMLSRFGRSQRAMYARHDGFEASAPVGSYPEGASAHGVLDLAGNVWEWTASRACSYDDKACRDSRRVCRGGTWFNHLASNVRAANRYMVAPSARSFDIGFRCVSGG